MTKGERRRNRRKYRVRYDRIVVMVLSLTVVVVLISSCVLALTNKESKPGIVRHNTSSDSAETSSSAVPDDDTSKNTSTTSKKEDASKTEESKPQPASENGFVTDHRSHDDIYKGDLVLVNAEYEYKFIAGDVDPVTLFDNRNDCYDNGDFVTKLDRNVLNKLNEMMQSFCDASSVSSSDIFILDGYRTFDEQAERHSSGKSKTFDAGHSDYHTGRTFDMFRMSSEGDISYFDPSGDCAWFAENAGKFGFIVRYPAGKDEVTGEKARAYTYRYVGVPHAEYMNANGLCLEEYISELKKHTKDKPLEITSGDTAYSVYYVKAEGDTTCDIPVPDDKMYTISGNNSDGFIVTAF